MRITKISIGLGAFGVITLMGSINRWFILYPDNSQLILGSLIGIGFILFAYIYNWMREKDRVLDKINIRQDAIVDWWMKREHESTIDKAKGII